MPGPVRIAGPYPPPLHPAPGPPRVTRYDRTRRPARHRRHRAPRPLAAQVWTGTAVLLAAAGVATVVGLPAGPPPPARRDVPVAVAAPATVPGGTPVPAAATRPALVLPLPRSVPAGVRIPALGVSSTVTALGLRADGSMAVPPAGYPVGWYDRSPTPGELGPAVLAGHVDWRGEPGAFYGLRALLPGDEVVVDRADGTVATFRVDRVARYDKDDFPTEEVYGDLDSAGLRLITCGGRFDPATGGYRQNVVVFAHLAGTG